MHWLPWLGAMQHCEKQLCMLCGYGEALLGDGIGKHLLHVLWWFLLVLCRAS
jgi:hypothetical protein